MKKTVKKFLLVDGYNIINAWRDIFDPRNDLEHNRSILTDILLDFQGGNDIQVIVVFDAHMVKGGKENIETIFDLIIVYTGENETADNYIERFVYENGSTHRIWVATSDYLEQTLVLSNGGARITPNELKRLLNDSKKDQRRIIESNNTQGNSLMNFLTSEQILILERLRRKKHGSN